MIWKIFSKICTTCLHRCLWTLCTNSTRILMIRVSKQN